MHSQRDHIGIVENAGTDNTAHDDHGGVEYAEQLPRFDRIQKSGSDGIVAKPARSREDLSSQTWPRSP
jgi:hypothetical protein